MLTSDFLRYAFQCLAENNQCYMRVKRKYENNGDIHRPESRARSNIQRLDTHAKIHRWAFVDIDGSYFKLS